MDDFLYQTYRAEWWIEQHMGILRQINWHGPFPNQQAAVTQSILLNDEYPGGSCKISMKMVPVEIDPILSNAVQGIAGLVAGWFSQAKDPSNPFATRPSGYVRLSGVESSMQQLSEVILKTFEINKENPDVFEDHQQE